MRAVMIDLETLGTGAADVVVVQIGAALFDLQTGEVWDTLLLDVDRASCEILGGRTTPRTLEWWAGRGGFQHAGEVVRMPTALRELRSFIERGDPDTVWAKGTDFDVSILTYYYNRMSTPTPWRFNDVRDMRTIAKVAELFGHSRTRTEDVPHQALEDCFVQIKELVEALDYLADHK